MGNKNLLPHNPQRRCRWFSPAWCLLVGALAMAACGDDTGGKKADCRRCDIDSDCESNSCHELLCINGAKVWICLPADYEPGTDNPSLICNPGDLC